MRWRQSVVLPEDSGPKISTTRPRGMPRPPRARSSESAPVEMPGMILVGSSSSRMMEPVPKARSIWLTAWSSAYFLAGSLSATSETVLVGVFMGLARFWKPLDFDLLAVDESAIVASPEVWTEGAGVRILIVPPYDSVCSGYVKGVVQYFLCFCLGVHSTSFFVCIHPGSKAKDRQIPHNQSSPRAIKKDLNGHLASLRAYGTGRVHWEPCEPGRKLGKGQGRC